MNIPAEIVAALIGGVVVLLGQYLLRGKTSAETNSINMDTIDKMGKQMDRLEKKVVDYRTDNDDLRGRIEILESQLEIKEATIKQKDCDIEKLQAQVNKLETRLTRILIYFSSLLSELNSKGVQYTPPEPGLLDTDPRIQAVKK